MAMDRHTLQSHRGSGGVLGVVGSRPRQLLPTPLGATQSKNRPLAAPAKVCLASAWIGLPTVPICTSIGLVMCVVE